MNAFSSDVDVLKFESGVFSDWFLSSQVLCGADNGIVAGTQFTAAGVDFIASGVAAGGVIFLQSTDGSINGAFEIVSVNDAGHLTVSVVRINDEQDAVGVGSASGLTWRIVTYAPQGYEVLWQLSQRLGLSPGCPLSDSGVDDIVNADTLRHVSVFGVLAMVLRMLQQGTDEQMVLREKLEHYMWQYEQAVNGLTIMVDTDGDGETERSLQPGVVRLVRK